MKTLEFYNLAKTPPEEGQEIAIWYSCNGKYGEAHWEDNGDLNVGGRTLDPLTECYWIPLDVWYDVIDGGAS